MKNNLVVVIYTTPKLSLTLLEEKQHTHPWPGGQGP